MSVSKPSELAKNCKLYRVSGTHSQTLKIERLPCSSLSLSSAHSFLLRSDTHLYVWFGSACNVHERVRTIYFARQLSQSAALPIDVFEEFCTPKRFWTLLGSNLIRDVRQDDDKPNSNELFLVHGEQVRSLAKGFAIERECLEPTRVCVLRTRSDVFVFAGSESNEADKVAGFVFAEKQLKRFVSDKLRLAAPLFVAESNEPEFFKAQVRGFDNAARFAEALKIHSQQTLHWKPTPNKDAPVPPRIVNAPAGAPRDSMSSSGSADTAMLKSPRRRKSSSSAAAAAAAAGAAAAAAAARGDQRIDDILFALDKLQRHNEQLERALLPRAKALADSAKFDISQRYSVMATGAALTTKLGVPGVSVTLHALAVSPHRLIFHASCYIDASKKTVLQCAVGDKREIARIDAIYQVGLCATAMPAALALNPGVVRERRLSEALEPRKDSLDMLVNQVDAALTRAEVAKTTTVAALVSPRRSRSPRRHRSGRSMSPRRAASPRRRRSLNPTPKKTDSSLSELVSQVDAALSLAESGRRSATTTPRKRHSQSRNK